MNVTVDYTLQRMIEPEPFPRHLLEPILMQTATESDFHYGIVAYDENRRRMVYRALLDLLEKLIDTIGQIVEKIVCDCIYFKNGSYIKVLSMNQYDYKGRGYRFDRTFYDEGVFQRYEQYYVSTTRYQPHVCEVPINPCIVTLAQPQEPRVDERLWEEMILNGITKERMNHYI